MSFINTKKWSKVMLGFGIVSFLTLPQYAYYWKRQQMKTFEKGILDDDKKLKEKGKTRLEIPTLLTKNKKVEEVKEFDDDEDEDVPVVRKPVKRSRKPDYRDESLFQDRV